MLPRRWTSLLRLPSALPQQSFGLGRCQGAALQSVEVRCFGVKARHKGCVYVPRKVARMTLAKTMRNHPDNTLLLPPYVSAAELRILFRVDYAGVMRMLGVSKEGGKYYWKDYDGREFESSSKRKVLVPFEIAAVPAESVGFRPRKVDVEPDWVPDAVVPAPPVPVVAVLGHIDHGKTTLLDSLCGTSAVADEPGGITQGVRAMTGRIGSEGSIELLQGGSTQAPRWRPSHLSELSGAEAATTSPGSTRKKSASSRLDAERITFLDTPGHAAFELLRGRTMATADVAIVVVSVERGAELQTEEVLIHAARWKVPVIFALNKIDLPSAHLELTRAELRRQCQLLHESGLVDVDWTKEAEEAVPISALYGQNLEALVGKLRQVAEELPQVPMRSLEPPTSTPGEARRCKDIHKRTDFLVGIDSAPSAVALVLEVEKAGEEQAETVLTLIVRSGRLVEGQYFAVGTAFGRITNLSVATGDDHRRVWTKCDNATVGAAVQMTGLRTRKVGGDCAPDDLLFALPRERAWRLCEHRQRIEQLASCQVLGPELEVSWETDARVDGRTQASFQREGVEQPEKHSGNAYDRRWAQSAVEEVSALGPPSFSGASRRDFAAALGPPRPLSQTGHEDNDESEAEPKTSGGRRSGLKRRLATAEASDTEQEGRRFRVLSPEEPQEQESDAPRSGGRKSARERQATGAWTSDPREQPEQEFVYYTDRKNWEEEAEIDTKRLRARWQWRDQARWKEQERQEQMLQEEKKLAERVRKEVFGEDDDGESTQDEDEIDVLQGDDSNSVEPLPQQNATVVPLILKTKSVSQFDVLMDEIERVQEAYGMRVVIVHGGLGPVIPKDVVHAEVEKRYGYCPIYAFQVGANPAAVGQAEAEHIDIRRFNVFTELVADLAARCERIQQKDNLKDYTDSLRLQNTSSGL